MYGISINYRIFKRELGCTFLGCTLFLKTNLVLKFSSPPDFNCCVPVVRFHPYESIGLNVSSTTENVQRFYTLQKTDGKAIENNSSFFKTKKTKFFPYICPTAHPLQFGSDEGGKREKKKQFSM